MGVRFANNPYRIQTHWTRGLVPLILRVGSYLSWKSPILQATSMVIDVDWHDDCMQYTRQENWWIYFCQSSGIWKVEMLPCSDDHAIKTLLLVSRVPEANEKSILLPRPHASEKYIFQRLQASCILGSKQKTMFKSSDAGCMLPFVPQFHFLQDVLKGRFESWLEREYRQTSNLLFFYRLWLIWGNVHSEIILI